KQTRGLVGGDAQGKVRPPSLGTRAGGAADTGDQLLDILDADESLQSHYYHPWNFTFSKLRWVQQNHPDLFDQIDKIMLPGDYLAYKMTGLIRSSITGLSEGIMWDFESNHADRILFEKNGIPPALIPEHHPTFTTQGEINSSAAAELGINPGVPVSYRSGDQPNNAWSLHVNEPGIMAG